MFPIEKSDFSDYPARMIEAALIRSLRSCADAYCVATGSALSTVARKALGDWRFFDSVEAGATFTARKYDVAVQWFADHWPETAVWPEEVERPKGSVKAVSA